MLSGIFSLGVQPLTGIHVVTIALNLPGPLAAERLRDLGARITKIEPPDGDPLQASVPALYAELTRDMVIERCDLKSAAGGARLQALLKDADLLLTSQRLRALARLGLEWHTLHAQFPRLCQVAIVGHPAPRQDVAGHDLTYLAAQGLLTPPALPPTLFVDVGGSEQAALAALAVVLERNRTGSGCYVELALEDTAKRLAAPRRAGLTPIGKLLGGGFPGYNLYRSTDGWVAVAALEPHFYRRLCEQFGTAEPSYELFAERFAARPNDHWRRFAEEHDLPIAIVGDEVPGV